MLTLQINYLNYEEPRLASSKLIDKELLQHAEEGWG